MGLNSKNPSLELRNEEWRRMKPKEARVLKELLLNSRRSDRALAREIKVTQPTVGRIRKTLAKEGFISEYTIIPNLARINVEMIAFITIKWNDYSRKDKLREIEDYLRKSDHVLFAAPGEGFQGKTKIIVSLHKDYKSFEIFIRRIRAGWASLIDEMDTFLVSSDNTTKDFSFRGVAKLLEIDEKE